MTGATGADRPSSLTRWWALGPRRRREVLAGDVHDPVARRAALTWAQAAVQPRGPQRRLDALVVAVCALTAGLVAAPAGPTRAPAAGVLVAALAVLAQVPLRRRREARARRILAHAAGDSSGAPPSVDPGALYLRMRRPATPAAPARRTRPRPSTVLALAAVPLSLLALALPEAVAPQHRVQLAGCPLHPVDPRVLTRWENGSVLNTHGCPVDSRWVPASGPGAGQGRASVTTFTSGDTIVGLPDGFAWVAPDMGAAWRSAGGPQGWLGLPLAGAGGLDLLRFQGGYALRDPAGAVTLHRGEVPAVTVAQQAWGDTGRPCVSARRGAPDTVEVSWLARPADAFDVRWLPADTDLEPAEQRETMDFGLTLTGLRPGRPYLIMVQACSKVAWGSSTCGPYSTLVVGP